MVDVEALAGYARVLLLGVRVTCNGDFIACCQEKCGPSGIERLKDELAVALSGARVTDPTKAERTGNLPSAVTEYERRMLEREPPKPVGILYDGFELCSVYNDLLSYAGTGADDLVLVITNQLFGTFEEGDSRYHARVIILGHPCIVSTSGMVEAPARPREYYLGKQLGLDRLSAEQGIPEKWLSPNDPRTTEVLKGYLAQALFYHVTGEPFCEKRGCRLFNAHWQEDMLFSQLEGESEFCRYHEKLLRTFTGATDG
ncbi:MAG: hypothetical protein L6427_08745 [Actinomycetia bacterium]|nr:hypothetical protein [Actinomycetes bacterium]